MSYTTLVKQTQEIKKMHEQFSRLYTHKKDRTEITLTREQYKTYCDAIIDKDYTGGNPLWHGIEIKRAGAK